MRTGGAIIIGWIHIMATVIWIGGIFFFDRILPPPMKELEPPQAGKLNQAVVKRFTPVAWLSIIVIIATGLIRAAGIGAFNLDTLFNTLYGNLLLGKMGLVVIMIINGLIITATSLRMSKLAAASPPSQEELAQLGLRIKSLSGTNLILGTVTIFLAVALRAIGL